MKIEHHIYLILSIFSLFASSIFGQADLEPEPTWPNFMERDWLLSSEGYPANIYRAEHQNSLVIANGLIRREILLDPNAATIALDNLMTGESILRGVKPEATVAINGQLYSIGGLVGQRNYAFLRDEDLTDLKLDSAQFIFESYQIRRAQAPFHWKRTRHHDSNAMWPPAGVQLQLNFRWSKPLIHVNDPTALDSVEVAIFYELYDGIPVIAKWMQVTNRASRPIEIDHFASEILAVVEYGSFVESRAIQVSKPNIHVETDFAFSSFNVDDANHHVVHWEADPAYDSQVNYLKLTPCLLKVYPEVGPAQRLSQNEVFKSFRTFVLPYDSYDRERNGLALRRMYRTLAPWTTENPLMMHARFADWEPVKKAIDQAAEVGFEMVILTFGSGFNVEDDSEEYLSKMKKYADYAKSKGIEIGGYSLLASRTIGKDQDVVMPEGSTPTFGNSPCIGSTWGEGYFDKLMHFYSTTGFSLLEHDGSYPGDVCVSENHPGHHGYEDSRWNQFQTISKFYQWCRGQGIYLNVPDYYYLSGSNKCGMGYREVNWSLPREQQVLHTRQNIYDGSWTKTPSMGWMFVPLTEYHGGGEAATIEPLNEHLDHYEKMIVSNLGAGVQACYRGPRLFDTDETKDLVRSQVDWYKKHREVLEGDIIHLRRADGRDIDYWLNVNPMGQEKGLLMIYNPLNKVVKKELEVPLYYTGLTSEVNVNNNLGVSRVEQMDRKYNVNLEVEVPANGFSWYIFKEGQ